MRFLLDMGISPKVIDVLQALGHEAVRCSEVGLSKASDTEILAYAQSHSLILISTDLDFADLVMVCKQPCPGMILLRLDNPSSEIMCIRLQLALGALEEDEVSGSLVIIQRNKVRTRKL